MRLAFGDGAARLDRLGIASRWSFPQFARGATATVVRRAENAGLAIFRALSDRNGRPGPESGQMTTQDSQSGHNPPERASRAELVCRYQVSMKGRFLPSR